MSMQGLHSPAVLATLHNVFKDVADAEAKAKAAPQADGAPPTEEDRKSPRTFDLAVRLLLQGVDLLRLPKRLGFKFSVPDGAAPRPGCTRVGARPAVS
jgi:hypothetical protein